jgi:hypothetical protein
MNLIFNKFIQTQRDLSFHEKMTGSEKFVNKGLSKCVVNEIALSENIQTQLQH